MDGDERPVGTAALAAQPTPASATPSPEPQRISEPARSAEPLGAKAATYVTPLVRKLAGEHGVDLASVTGTGVGGRIRKQDVLEAAKAQQPAAPEPTPAPAAKAPSASVVLTTRNRMSWPYSGKSTRRQARKANTGRNQ